MAYVVPFSYLSHNFLIYFIQNKFTIDSDIWGNINYMYVWSPYKVTQFEWLGISERGESYEIFKYILSKLMYRRFVAANIHAVIKNANYGIGDKRVTPGGPGGDICLWCWPRSLFNLLTRCNSPPQKGCVTPCTPNHTYNLTPFSLFVIRDFKEETEIRRLQDDISLKWFILDLVM